MSMPSSQKLDPATTFGLGFIEPRQKVKLEISRAEDDGSVEVRLTVIGDVGNYHAVDEGVGACINEYTYYSYTADLEMIGTVYTRTKRSDVRIDFIKIS